VSSGNVNGDFTPWLLLLHRPIPTGGSRPDGVILEQNERLPAVPLDEQQIGTDKVGTCWRPPPAQPRCAHQRCPNGRSATRAIGRQRRMLAPPNLVSGRSVPSTVRRSRPSDALSMGPSPPLRGQPDEVRSPMGGPPKIGSARPNELGEPSNGATPKVKMPPSESRPAAGVDHQRWPSARSDVADAQFHLTWARHTGGGGIDSNPMP
jgi:hypothetical protein